MKLHPGLTLEVFNAIVEEADQVDYRADLILLDSNPLETIPFNDRIEGVMINGIWYGRAELDKMFE